MWLVGVALCPEFTLLFGRSYVVQRMGSKSLMSSEKVSQNLDVNKCTQVIPHKPTLNLFRANRDWARICRHQDLYYFSENKSCYRRARRMNGASKLKWTFFNNLHTLTLGLPGLTLKNWSTFKKRGEERRSQVEKEHINTMNIRTPQPDFKEGIEEYVDCGTMTEK